MLRRRFFVSHDEPYGVYGLNTAGEMFAETRSFTGTPQGIYVHNTMVGQPRIYWPQYALMQWADSGSTGLIQEVMCTSDVNVAIHDLDGKASTAIIAASKGSGAPAAYNTLNSFSNGIVGVGDWYLPSVGETYAIFAYNDVAWSTAFVNWCKKFNADFILSKEFWCTTQYDNGVAWTYTFSYPGGDICRMGYSHRDKYHALLGGGRVVPCCLWEDFTKNLW